MRWSSWCQLQRKSKVFLPTGSLLPTSTQTSATMNTNHIPRDFVLSNEAKKKKKKSSRHLHVWMIFNLKTCKAIADSEWKRPAVTEETFQKFQNGQRKSKWEKLSETSEVKRSQMFSRLNWPKACRYFRQPHDLKMETEQQREREMEKEQRNSRAGKWVTKAELWAPCLVTVL